MADNRKPEKETYFHHTKKPPRLTEQEKRRSRTKVILVLAAVTVLAVLSWWLTSEKAGCAKKPTTEGPTSMYSDRLVSYAFYPSDYDLDVTTVDEYMQLDRIVRYKNGGLTLGVTKDDPDGTNAAVRFFLTYFDTVIAGDYETYNTYFTDHYYETEEPYVSFAPQMLYNIEVEQLDESVESDGTTKWTFYVSYMIYRNDGSFRNDIPSDAIRKLRYELIEDRDGTVRIDRICYYLDK